MFYGRIKIKGRIEGCKLRSQKVIGKAGKNGNSRELTQLGSPRRNGSELATSQQDQRKLTKINLTLKVNSSNEEPFCKAKQLIGVEI